MSDGDGGRRETSVGGLIGAMAVIVALVVAAVLLRNVVFGGDVLDENGRPTDLENPAAVDYLDTVLVLQQSGVDVTYPASLPEGWIATQIGANPGERPTFRINLATDDRSFVGLRQEDKDVDEMLTTYVDKNAAEEEPLVGVGSLADTWQGWSDSGGDHAYSAEVEGQTVLVFGDVSAETLAGLVELLTTEPVPAASISPSPQSPSTP